MHAIGDQGHEAMPEPGTARRANGQPASLDNPVHYPVTAACRTCGAEIWKKSLLLHPWQHMETGEN